MGNYTEEIKKQNILKLRNLLAEMPPFCTDYFRGIAGSKGERTRVGYCRNIFTFLQFITQVNPVYKDVSIKNLPLSVSDEMTSADIDEYMEYLRYYVINGVEYSNSEPTIARNLSAISSMYSFFNKRQSIKNNPLNAVERPKLHDKVIVTNVPIRLVITFSILEKEIIERFIALNDVPFLWQRESNANVIVEK